MEYRKHFVQLAILSALLFSSIFAWSIGPFINYQGKVTDPSGAGINDNSATFVFRLYDAASGGSLQWEETHDNVRIDNGIFNIILGKATALPKGDVFGAIDLWLEVECEGEVMSPRQELTSVAGSLYAKHAANAEKVDGLDSSQLGDITAVIAGKGLSGGGMSGDVTLHADESDPQVGTNTQNHISKWNGSALVAGSIYDNGLADNGSERSSNIGVYGRSDGDYGAAGVYGEATNTSGNNRGVWGHTENANGHAGYFTGGRNYFQGNVGIGTAAPEEKLHVDGDIRLNAGGDIAFADDNTQIREYTDDLYIEADDDIYVAPDDDIRMKGNTLFVDGSANRVGVGTTVPETKVEIRGDGKSWRNGFLSIKNINEAAGIRLYDSYTTVKHHIFNANDKGDILRIAPDGSYAAGGITVTQGGRVGIGTVSPGEQLDISGDIQVSGDYRYASSKRHYLNMPVCEFKREHPFHSSFYSYDFVMDYCYYGYIAYGSSPCDATIIAPVKLPDGAKIRVLKVYYYDNDVDNDLDLTAILKRRKITDTSERIVAEISTSSSGASSDIHSDDVSCHFELVDNSDYQYVIEVTWIQDDKGSDLRFYGCRIEYEIDALM